MIEEENNPINTRFRGFLPVVVDVETGGFNANKHALLEVAAVPILMNADGTVGMAKTLSCHVEPFPGSAMEEEALQFTGIDPYNPFRMAMPEKEALEHIFESGIIHFLIWGLLKPQPTDARLRRILFTNLAHSIPQL